MATRSSRTGARDKGGPRREPIDPADVEAAAQRLGIEQLHPEQEHVLDGVFAGRDVLMVLPTGFGKSACYQIPSMILPQPVVVISPLLALMRDQEEKSDQRFFDIYEYEASSYERELIYQMLIDRAPSAVVVHLAEELGEARSDGLGPYLEARQLLGQRRYALALPLLREAAQRGLPSVRLERELGRLQGVTLFALERYAESAEVWKARTGISRASDAESQRWLERIEYAGNEKVTDKNLAKQTGLEPGGAVDPYAVPLLPSSSAGPF